MDNYFKSQRTVAVSPVYASTGPTEITIWGRPLDAEQKQFPEAAGRLGLTVSTGCAVAHIRPTPAEARRLALELNAAADQFEGVAL